MLPWRNGRRGWFKPNCLMARRFESFREYQIQLSWKPDGHAMRVMKHLDDPAGGSRRKKPSLCGYSSVVERHVANVNVVSSNPTSRSNF